MRKWEGSGGGLAECGWLKDEASMMARCMPKVDGRGGVRAARIGEDRRVEDGPKYGLGKRCVAEYRSDRCADKDGGEEGRFRMLRGWKNF